ncbi:hypothetical protein RJ55_06887 [Drechmeria coniospora]|nr:hypothetical protein RJ55_06887 [Drechmeria coniospora]
MRTRTSNRTKTFTVERYEFDSSSDDKDVEPPRKRKNAEERDANFDDALDANEALDEDEESDNEKENAVLAESDAAGPSADTPHKWPRSHISRHRRKPLKARLPAGSALAYRDIDPVPPDSHAVKSYVGPYSRTIRGLAMVEMWYGPTLSKIRLAQRLLDRWIGWTVLPPKVVAHDEHLGLRAVWTPGFFEGEARFALSWMERVRSSLARGHGPPQLRQLSSDEAAPYQLSSGSLPVLVGPYPNQSEICLAPTEACSIAHSGLPFAKDEDATKMAGGWVLDAAGIVIGMDWAPRSRELAVQVLALAVIPHADQRNYNFEVEHQKPDFERHGVVQIWAFRGDKSQHNVARPSTLPPRLQRTLCFDYGRARRVRWSPGCELLAVLCGDGRICIVQVDCDDEGERGYEMVQNPVASLLLSNEQAVKATAMAWVSLNRLVAGYSDGSIALWSVHPPCLLSRHPTHHSAVVDIATGYPAMPYLVASTPVGGSAKLFDLRAPSIETTEVQTNAVNWQPNLLSWSDHTQGFYSTYPSANALNTMVGFMNHRHFPLVRRVFTSDCFLACLSVGKTHPFLLVGTTDGSLWSLNPQGELFKARRPPQDRLRIFQHRHRSADMFPQHSPASARGASQIIHGFAMEKNLHGPAEAKPAPKKFKKAKKADEADEGGADDEPAALADPTRGIVHELGTRITVVEWNPNVEYGCWAAAAMASGLVRVMDLGLENVGDGDG